MPKLTEYPEAQSFDENDILIKDGTNGTKKIKIEKVLEYMVDPTLTTPGKAADAKATKDAIDAVGEDVADVKTQVNKVTEPSINIVAGKIDGVTINDSGKIVPNESYRLYYAPITLGTTYTISTDQPDSSLTYGYFNDVPAVNSIAYDNTRQRSNKTFTAPINGYVAFRTSASYEYGQLEVGTQASPYVSPDALSAVDIVARNDISNAQNDIQNETTKTDNALINLQNNIVYYDIITGEYVDNTTGDFVQHPTWNRTDYIPVSKCSALIVTKSNASVYNAFYNANKEPLTNPSFNTPSGTTTIDIPSGAAYAVLSDSATGLANTSVSYISSPATDAIKEVLVVNPFFMERYVGDTVEGEALTRAGSYIRFDSILIKTNKGAAYTADWNQFLTDLSASFSPSGSINAPVNAYDFTTNCAKISKQFLLVYNIKKGVFENISINGALTDSQVILFGSDADTNPFGPIYEQAKLVFKRGLECYEDDFIEIENDCLNGGYDFTFTFATDCHFPFDDKTAYYNPTNEVIKAIDEDIHVDAIINGGDSIWHGSKNRLYGIGAANHVFRGLAQDKIVYCMGNHDWNGVSGIGYIQNEAWNFTNSQTQTLYMRHNQNVELSSDPSIKYFYRDFTDKKIRVIVLNTSDIDVSFTNGIADIDPLGVLGLRQAQLTWLANTALNVPDDDWHILIIMHGGLYLSADGFPGNTNVINKASVINILSAYVNKTTYSYSETDSTHNGYFTVSGSGTFSGYKGTLVAVFSGHAHADGYCDKDGFNAIQTECSYLDYAQKPQRIVRTIDEVAVDCVSVNKTAKTIKLTRFGYGNSRNYTY